MDVDIQTRKYKTENTRKAMSRLTDFITEELVPIFKRAEARKNPESFRAFKGDLIKKMNLTEQGETLEVWLTFRCASYQYGDAEFVGNLFDTDAYKENALMASYLKFLADNNIEVTKAQHITSGKSYFTVEMTFEKK